MALWMTPPPDAGGTAPIPPRVGGTPDTVKKSIEEQGKLTEELAAAIDNAQTLAEVEDLYRPYKQKRRTRATVAREKGLEPWHSCCLPRAKLPPVEEAAQSFIDSEKGRGDGGGCSKEQMTSSPSGSATMRPSANLRELLEQRGILRSLAATEEDSVYRLYYDF